MVTNTGKWWEIIVFVAFSRDCFKFKNQKIIYTLKPLINSNPIAEFIKDPLKKYIRHRTSNICSSFFYLPFELSLTG